MTGEPSIVVVDAENEAGDGFLESIRTACTDVRVESPDTVTGDSSGAIDVIVTRGRSSFRSVAIRGPDAPILPVDAGIGGTDVSPDAVGSALRSVVDGVVQRETHPVFSVSTADEQIGTGVFDCSLCSATPARISEYRVSTVTRQELVTVRADGIVVATPAGSHGYARNAGGPFLSPETGLVVVPISPFQTAHDRWVVPIDRVSLSVRRDDVPISVRVDGAERGRIDGTGTVVVEPTDTIEVVVPEGRLAQ